MEKWLVLLDCGHWHAVEIPPLTGPPVSVGTSVPCLTDSGRSVVRHVFQEAE